MRTHQGMGRAFHLMTRRAQPELSVVIVNWNACSYLERCLATVYENSDGLQVDVIVVDNASTDGSEAMVRRQYPQALMLQTGRNLGFARANNLGVQHACGETVLFLNPDTEVTGSALADMVGLLQSEPRMGVVGARLLNSDGSWQESCIQAFPTMWNQFLDSELLRRLFPSSKLWGRQLCEGDNGSAVEVDAVSGACLMVQREVFEQIGGFDEKYFMYSDDLDLCYRTRKAGYSVKYLDGCRVVHHKGQSSAQQDQQFEALQQRESMAQFFRATKGQAYAAIYKFGMGIIAGIRAMLVLGLMACGKTAVQGRAIRSVLRKWVAILRWAVGLEAYKSQAGVVEQA